MNGRRIASKLRNKNKKSNQVDENEALVPQAAVVAVRQGERQVLVCAPVGAKKHQDYCGHIMNFKLICTL